MRAYALICVGLVGTFAAPTAHAGSATYPVAAVATCDGVADDTHAIRSLIASVPSGAVIEFPAFATCRLTGGLLVDRPMSLVGYHSRLIRTDVHPLSGAGSAHIPGAIIAITSSHVLVQGLTLRGQVYGSMGARNTHGVWAIPDGAKKAGRLTNITVRNVNVSRMRGRGVSLTRVDDFIVEDCHVEDVGYAGIFVEAVRRGAIRRNHVEDIGDPEDCEGQLATCRSTTTYGIVVTGGGNKGATPMSEDVLIVGNLVRENELWGGIVNHGCVRTLILDNAVYDTNFSYANTSATSPSSHTAFINNLGDIQPIAAGGRYDLPQGFRHAPPWGVGLWHNATTAPANDVRVIGNVLRNTGGAGQHAGIAAWALNSATFAWNEIESDRGLTPPASGIRLRTQFAGGISRTVVAHNRLQTVGQGIWSDHAGAVLSTVGDNHLVSGQFGLRVSGGGQWAETGNSFGAASTAEITGAFASWGPPIFSAAPPSALSATADGSGQVELTWSAGPSPHDAFVIEGRRFGGSWQRIAFRPPDRAMWAFDAPSNPFWVPFDPTRYIAEGLASGFWQFRIAALWGTAVSPWSALAGTWVP